MRERMEIVKENAGVIGWHYVDDIVVWTVDTFGSVKKLTDREYHGCGESDSGACVAVVTKSDCFMNHIYPKDVLARFIPEINEAH